MISQCSWIKTRLFIRGHLIQRYLPFSTLHLKPKAPPDGGASENAHGDAQDS
jgi:hypothetical protein